MKVKIELVEEITEPYIVIYADKVSPLITKIASVLESMIDENVIAVHDKGRISVLQPDDIYMVTIEDEHTVVHCKDKKINCSKRLYEFEEQLGSSFMRISKSTIVNLQHLDYVEPGWGGSMLLTLKNGSKDYISRKYLPTFKKYLGL